MSRAPFMSAAQSRTKICQTSIFRPIAAAIAQLTHQRLPINSNAGIQVHSPNRN